MPWQITRYSCPGTVKIKLCPVSARFFSPFLSLPSPLHSPSFFLFPCPLLHSPFCWEVRIQGGGGSPAGAAATAAVEPQLLRLSKWSWWVKKSHQNGGFCSSSSPQGPVAKAALLAHSGASTYSAFPALPDTRHAIPSALHPADLRCGSGTSSPCAAIYCHRRIMLLVGDASFPQGRASCTGAHCMHKHAHEQAQRLALKAAAIPAVPLALYLHSAKNERVKSLLKHEKLITLVLGLAEQGSMRGRRRWGSRNERIFCKPNKQYSVSVISISSWFVFPWKLQPLKINLNILILGLMVWFPYRISWGCPQPESTDGQQLKIIVLYNISNTLRYWVMTGDSPYASSDKSELFSKSLFRKRVS